MNTNVEQVLMHHLTAFGDNNLDAIVEDYTEESVILAPQGKIVGIKDIRSFFADFFAVIPTGSAFAMKQKVVSKDVAYILWKSESESFKIRVGTDTFFFENDKIKYHTVADDRMEK